MYILDDVVRDAADIKLKLRNEVRIADYTLRIFEKDHMDIEISNKFGGVAGERD